MKTKYALLAAVASALLASAVPAQAARVHGHHKTQNGFVSQAQAKKAALARVGGRVISVDFERDDEDERAHYDIDIIKNHVEYNVKVDARSGRVIRVHQDD